MVSPTPTSRTKLVTVASKSKVDIRFLKICDLKMMKYNANVFSDLGTEELEVVLNPKFNAFTIST